MKTYILVILFAAVLMGCKQDAQAFQGIPDVFPDPNTVVDVPEPEPEPVDGTRSPITVIVAGFGASLHGDAFGGCETSAAKSFEKLLTAAARRKNDVAFTQLPCDDASWKVGPINHFDVMQESLGVDDSRLIGFNWMRKLIAPDDIAEVNPTWRTNTVLELDRLLAQANENGPVQVVAHSFGALAVDFCIQSGYCATVQKVVRLGPPVRGSVNAYYLINGEVQGTLISSWSGEVLLEYMKSGLHDGIISDMKFVREYIPSAEQLLPIDDYIKRSVGWFGAVETIPVEEMCFDNTFLQGFNAVAHNSVPSLTIYGTELPTLAVLRTYNQPHINSHCKQQRWPDGAPGIFGIGSSYDVYRDGDGTVTALSATALDVPSMAIPYGLHSTTLLTSDVMLQRIKEFLD